MENVLGLNCHLSRQTVLYDNLSLHHEPWLWNAAGRPRHVTPAAEVQPARVPSAHHDHVDLHVHDRVHDPGLRFPS